MGLMLAVPVGILLLYLRACKIQFCDWLPAVAAACILTSHSHDV